MNDKEYLKHLQESILEFKQPIPTHKDYMKRGWPQTDWGWAFQDADERFSWGYKIQMCVNKYKPRYGRDEQLCSLPWELKEEMQFLNWMKSKGLSLCRKTQDKQSDCFKFAKQKMEAAQKEILRIQKKLKELKRVKS